MTNTTNPYASPKGLVRNVHQGQRAYWQLAGWLTITLLTAAGWAVFPIEEWPIRRILQSSIYLAFLFLGLPAVGWEWLGRKTPRPSKRSDSLNSSFLRCILLYLFAFVLGQSVFSSFAGQAWSNGDDPMTPEMQLMYMKHGVANFGAVLFASAVLVIYDLWRASRSQLVNEPSEVTDATALDSRVTSPRQHDPREPSNR